jgi:hypothetical protein
MDIEALRKQYLAELKAEATAAEPPASPEEVAQYAASDKRDDVKMCEMIASLSLDRDSYAASVRTLIDILANRAIGTIARLAALRQLGSAEFHAVRFAPFHAEYIAVLRRLALDEDKDIRTAMLERLTLTNDSEAQKLLREGLENARKALVPAAKAVQLLARDDHGSGTPIFRRLAESAKGQVREQALRALASDPRSAGLFERIAADKGEKTPIREIAALSLKHASASRFAKLARKLALDEDDDDRLRATAVAAITHAGEVASKLATPRFANALKSVAQATKSRTLKSSIERFAKAHWK